MSTKEHKFFDRHLNIDTDRLSRYLLMQSEKIQNATLPGIKELGDKEFWVESGSISTVKWREYNVFQFLNEDLYTLYKTISEVTKEACEYYEIDFDKQKYMTQGWFNVNYNKTGKLNWHDHGGPYAPHFHGYYSVKAEPSVTYYRIFNDPSREVANHNIDNRMIISEMGHPHAQADWDWDGPRITVAYDIVPLQSLINANTSEQHWLPLL